MIFSAIPLNRAAERSLMILGLLLTAAAAMGAIVASFEVTRMTLGASGIPCLVASMGASAVILYALPETPAARAWSLFGGHLLSGLVGVLIVRFAGDVKGAPALAVGGALLVMGLFRCIHPPGGATALTVVLGGPELKELGFLFLVNPLLVNLVVLGSITWAFSYARRVARERSSPDPHGETRPDRGRNSRAGD